MASPNPSYIDYAAFTAPDFSPTAYANSLVLQTNNANDTPLDLSTPLSRVLFDVQEVDTHIDTLTTKHALPIITHTRERSDASKRVLEEVEGQVRGLEASYKRLEREVVERFEAAEQVRGAAERMVRALRLGRGVQRAVGLGRVLEGQMEGIAGREGQGQGQLRGVDCRGMLPAANTLLGLRALFGATGKGEEGEGLGRVVVVGTLRNEIVMPAERTLVARAQQVVREFSMSSLLASSGPQGGGGGQGQGQGQGPGQGQQQTYAQTEDTKSRATSALQTLYLLSPTKASSTATLASFEPTLLISALQSYLQTALTSSLAALTRALATLPTLDRTLLEISARCQNIVALEALLASIKPPPHPLLAPPAPSLPPTPADPAPNFLHPLLRHLDTSSLPSYFWRTLASQLSARVTDILARGGVSARTLRSNRERVREMVRECVDRGSQLPVSALALGGGGGRRPGGNWEREAAVMVGSVVGPLQR
ncbi:hypothetical protein LTR36_007758 [Oleoguttula mirabilis]|uniref:Conserved oligomeric Golgi complex subunit 5 n=1 Tax=Oleoguttula mirabilis TaxID=1507867 RepID=A0AAV9JXE5_9PEZI|nr:hypothetical protein LTR36_007758 [Oleoguttula mirabilis]